MSHKYILDLNDQSASIDIVGGKGMSLSKLANAGLPVPGGFHISTTAYRKFVEENNLIEPMNELLMKANLGDLALLEKISSRIANLFTKAVIPPFLASEIVRAYAGLPGGNPSVAVRSSATAEDLKEASFAGQQETFLNISGTDNVLKAVIKCWASLWTARAIGYRARNAIHQENLAMAVVVQLMVNADAAGIMFTVNPVNGNRDQAVISAAWGLGEAVVGGEVTPDTLVLNKSNGSVVSREIAIKQLMTCRTVSGTENQPVPSALREAPVLSDEQAKRLTAVGKEIENLYSGHPMDIEWALVEGKFAILQARPVTGISNITVKWVPPDPKGVYMRGSVADLAPKPLSPLYCTLGIPTLVEQMQPLGNHLTGSDPVLASDYLTTINGIAYVNSTFPPKAIWWILTGLMRVYIKIFLNKLTPIWRDELLPGYKEFVAGKLSKDPKQMRSAALWQDTQALVSAAAYYICGLMFATMGASAGSEGLLTSVYNKMVKKEGDPDVSALLMGWDNIAVRSEKSLFDIAKWVRERPDFEKYFLDTPSSSLAALLNTQKLNISTKLPQAQLWDQFTSLFNKHLDNFGYIVYQLDFADPLPRDLPEIFLENIKLFIQSPQINPYKRQKSSEKNRINASKIMLGRLHGLKLGLFRWVLNWGQAMAEIREDALAEIGLAYPRIRTLLGELGRRFTQADAIQSATDIYWLKKDEIQETINKLEHVKSPAHFSDIVKERKAFNHLIGQMTPPHMIPMKKRVMGFKTDVFLPKSSDSLTGNIIKGVPTSAGRITAPAQVLTGPEDFSKMRSGDVLVAGTTTPAWTPLFSMASALVTDIGGPLSHGSIVAREYGIPAVMGTGIATKRILTGQQITVDGGAGTVEIL